MIFKVGLKNPALYKDVELLKLYLKLKLFKKSFNISLLCSPKLLNFWKGSGTCVKGLWRFCCNKSWLGTLSGTFLKPSMSSENVIISVGKSVSWLSALTIIEVRATSPKVPIWGNPLGPYPVWRVILPFFSIKAFLSRSIFLASTKGQALVFSRTSFLIMNCSF